VGLSNAGQMWSPRDTCVSPPWRALHISVASFFVWPVSRCACDRPRFSSILKRQWIRVQLTRRCG